MKLTSLSIILLFTCLWACAQESSIKGRVHHRGEDKAYPEVQIRIIGTDFQTESDPRGNFSFSDIPEGTYELELHHYDQPDTLISGLVLKKGETLELEIPWPPVSDCPYDLNRDDPTCPVCHKQDSVVPILYGFPTEESFEAAERGELSLGGCEVSDCDPSWWCKRDNKEF